MTLLRSSALQGTLGVRGDGASLPPLAVGAWGERRGRTTVSFPILLVDEAEQEVLWTLFPRPSDGVYINELRCYF